MRTSSYSLQPMSATWYTRLLESMRPGYWMTIGDTIYHPSNIQQDTIHTRHSITIQHELIHVFQYRRYGVVPFLLLYFLAPLPVGFAYFRWRFEREAYMVNIRYGANPELVVDTLWYDYGWTWPKFLMRRWFAKEIQRRRINND